jgi:hypothetical protein
MFISQVRKMQNIKSREKTTAAKLRSIIGEKDSVWADMLGKSVHSIRHLEAGTLKLSPALAAKMNYETGISIKWLMDGNPDVPPVSFRGGQKFTKAIYERIQAEKKHFAQVKEKDINNNLPEFIGIIYGILRSANRKHDFHLAVYKIWRALNELRNEFGADETKLVRGVVRIKPKLKRPSRKRRRKA